MYSRSLMFGLQHSPSDGNGAGGGEGGVGTQTLSEWMCTASRQSLQCRHAPFVRLFARTTEEALN